MNNFKNFPLDSLLVPRILNQNVTYVLVFLFFSLFGIQAQETEKDVLRTKKDLLSKAVQLGKLYKVDLDFTDSSISQVEYILSDISAIYQETDNDEGLHGIAYILGIYIIEVIDSNHGKGRIERDHPELGENSYPYYWNNSVLFPVTWCRKRIFEGEGDNVNLKYKIAVLDAAED